jgi:hypothetical protein
MGSAVWAAAIVRRMAATKSSLMIVLSGRCAP